MGINPAPALNTRLNYCGHHSGGGFRTKSSLELPTNLKAWEKDPVPILDFKSLRVTGPTKPRSHRGLNLTRPGPNTF
jgi:hypothetical protein